MKPRKLKTPKDLGITAFQYYNFLKLLLFLRDKEKDINLVMVAFHENGPYADEVEENVCGAAACLVGHGPIAGIKAYRQESWTNYATRVFTGQNPRGNIFDFCFYDYHTNSVKDGMRRISYFLTHGLERLQKDRQKGMLSYKPAEPGISREVYEVKAEAYQIPWKLIEKTFKEYEKTIKN